MYSVFDQFTTFTSIETFD